MLEGSFSVILMRELSSLQKFSQLASRVNIKSYLEIQCFVWIGPNVRRDHCCADTFILRSQAKQKGSQRLIK